MRSCTLLLTAAMFAFAAAAVADEGPATTPQAVVDTALTPPAPAANAPIDPSTSAATGAHGGMVDDAATAAGSASAGQRWPVLQCRLCRTLGEAACSNCSSRY